MAAVNYKLTSEKTTSKAWPCKIHIELTVPPSACHNTLQDIHDWLNSNNIKYQYAAGLNWYFKDEQDAIAFILKWS